MNLQNWKPEVWKDLEAHEALVEATGGEALAAAQGAVIAAQEALMATLSPAQVVLFHGALDALSDQRGLHKEAVERVALAYGIAIGSALASSPEAEPAAIFRPAAEIATVLFGSALKPAEMAALAGSVLSVLERAGL